MKLFAYIIVLLAMLAPMIIDISWMPTFSFENPLILLALLGMIFFGGRSLGAVLFPIPLRQMTVPYFSLLLWMAVMTVLYSIMTESAIRIPYNLVGCLSKIKPFVFLVVLYAAIRDRRTLRGLGALLILILFVEMVVLYMQKYNLLDVNSWFTIYFQQQERGKSYFGRSVGTIGNPNNVGTVLSVLATLAYAYALHGTGVLFRFLCGLGALLALLSCIWLTQSRQGVVCVLAGCATVQMLTIFRSRKYGRGIVFLVIGIVAFVVIVGYVQASPDSKFAQRFGMLSGQSSALEAGSLQSRFYTWKSFFEVEGMGALWGRGSRLYTEGIGTWDSGYLETIRFAGFGGLIALILLHTLPAVGAYKRLGQIAPEHPDYPLHMALVGILPSILLLLFINNTWTAPRVMTMILPIYALSLAAQRIENEEAEAEAMWLATAPDMMVSQEDGFPELRRHG